MRHVIIHGVAVDENQNNFFVLLKDPEHKNMWVPVPTSPREAREIAVAMHGNEMTPRPLTHDLLAKILEELGAVVNRVNVYGKPGDTITARIDMVSKDGTEKQMEVSAPDALAIAVRTESEVVVADDALMPIDDSQLLKEDMSEQTQHRLNTLQREMSEAIDKEDYEKAAQLRGRLQDVIRLEKESDDLPENINEELRRAYQGENSPPDKTSESSN